MNQSEIQCQSKRTCAAPWRAIADCPRARAACGFAVGGDVGSAEGDPARPRGPRAAGGGDPARDSPDRLWRRLGCVACEDIGLGDLEAVGIATAALAGVRKRAELGGDWPVACAVVAALARAPKCRAADDLLMICELHPAYARQRIEFRHRSSRELVDDRLRSGGDRGTRGRAVARARRRPAPRSACGGREAKRRPCSIVYAKPAGPARWSKSRGRTSTATESPWARSSPSWRGNRWRGRASKPDDVPPEVTIDGTPGWAFDLYTREGRAAYARFLATDSRSAEWLRRHVSGSRRIAVVGHCVFRVEGGLVDRRLHWALADQLRKEVDAFCAGPGCSDVSELLELVRADLPRLNEVRVRLLGRDGHRGDASSTEPH